MSKLSQRLQQRGDTIVEVLVVLAVVSLALTISYATANRSLLGVRQSQEHSEALQLAQAQLEELRALANNGALASFTGQNCMNNGAPSTSCTFAFESLAPNAASGYTVAITNAPSSAADDPNYTITITWPDVTGKYTDKVTLTYRLPA